MVDISLDGIEVLRDGKTILSIHESIPAAGITAIIGPNGAGKTTLLKVIHGLIKPTQGVLSMKIRSALVLHHTPFIKASVRTNLTLMRDVLKDLSTQQIDDVIKRVGLQSLSERIATQLSAGEKQRLALARALLQDPQLVLLDEPTANLDPKATEYVEQMIQTMAQEQRTVIFTSHHLGQVRRLSDHVMYIEDGQCQEISRSEDFFNQPKSSKAIQFLAREL